MFQGLSKILVLLSVLSLSNIQAATIKGIVTDNYGPIKYANISLSATNYSSYTDSSGSFKINNLAVGKYLLSIEAYGHDAFTKNILLTSEDQMLDLGEIELKEVFYVLDTIILKREQKVISGTLQEVTKSESAIPIEIYTADYFKANPNPSLFESMQNVNGVRPQLNCNVCNTGDIHINGLEGPYTMILIDGMPIVSGLSTVYGLTGIPQSLIERIEIVKGPASTLYGSEAVGGLINIITKKPSNAPIFSADVYSSNWLDVNTDIGMKFKAGKKAQSILGLNYFNYQNPIDNNKDGFTDITLQNRISVFNKWTLDRKENRLFSIAGRYVYEDRWGGDMNWNKSFRGGDSIYAENINTKRWEFFGTYQLPMKEKIMLQYSANSHQQNSVYGKVPYIAEQYIGFGQLTWFKTIRTHHNLLVGTAFRYTYYDDNTPATQSFATQKNAPSKIALPGIFVQDEVKINLKHTILAGLRYDYNSIHGNVFTPRINYKFSSINKRNTLRLSAGNGYRVANVFTEDHAALTGSRTVVFVGELKPETSWNGNINFEKKFMIKDKTYVGLDATTFYTYFNNRIIPDYETDANKIIYSNLNGNAVSKGFSLNADIEFKSGMKILTGGTLMKVDFTENGVTTRQLLTESFSGVWSIKYPLKKHNITLDYTGNIYGPMRLPLLGALDNRPAKSPVWSLQNIQVTKKFAKGIEVYGGVKNLLNFTPPKNSIARAFDPFDKQVQFDANGQAIATVNNPNALTFDPSYVFAPNQGIRVFIGFRYTFDKK